MFNITGGFSRNISKSFSGSHFAPEICEKFNEVSVSGFESTLTEEYLQRWFSNVCGGVKCVKMAKSEYGKSLGFCTVCFYRPLDAQRAVQEANNRELNGRILTVKLHKCSKEQSEAPGKCVFVKGFGETLDDKKLEIYFKDRIGNVERAEVAKFENGVSKGYGKVHFCNQQDARKAVMELNGVVVHGNTLLVELFKSKEQRQQEPNRNVYVKGFGDIFGDDDDLRKLFERFGKIDNAKIERDVNGKLRGFGYVCFQRYQDAKKAITEMNGKKLGSKLLTVSAHQSKEERQKEIKNKNLHVRDLHKSVSENELKELFAPYGKILSAAVKNSPLPGINQGYVCFETSKEADNAVAALHLYRYKGLKLKVSPVQAKNKANLTKQGDSMLKCSDSYVSDTRAMMTYEKLNAYKNRSKSLGKLTKINAKLHVLQDGKSLELTRMEMSSLMQNYEKNVFSKKVLENSDQNDETPKLGANEVSSLKEIGKEIPENFHQVCRNPEPFCNEISLPKSTVPSQIVVLHNNNQDKNLENLANETKSLQMPMAMPDLLEETRKSFVTETGTSKSEEHSVTTQNSCRPFHVQSPSTVIPKEQMNSRKQPAKKAYICGASVRKS